MDGAPVAALALASREAHVISDEELHLLQEVTANLSFALQYLQHEDTADYLASFDPLTGLAKRVLFCQHLDQFLRNRPPLESAPTVAAFDLMHLSKVNNSFGRRESASLSMISKRAAHRSACCRGCPSTSLIKIDRSFITGLPEEQASVTLVSTVIGLASAFGLRIVAEGVETEGQLGKLRELGCDQSQGYFHSRPVAVEQFEKLLRDRSS